MPRYGMVIDLDRCIGCRACAEACKVENNTPTANFWMYVFRFEEGAYPNTNVWFMPRPCQHCDNAPCVKVCPVGARFKRDDGIVSTDWDRCIGCRYCEVSCPYGVNYFNWKAPTRPTTRMGTTLRCRRGLRARSRPTATRTWRRPTASAMSPVAVGRRASSRSAPSACNALRRAWSRPASRTAHWTRCNSATWTIRTVPPRGSWVASGRSGSWSKRGQSRAFTTSAVISPARRRARLKP